MKDENKEASITVETDKTTECYYEEDAPGLVARHAGGGVFFVQSMPWGRSETKEKETDDFVLMHSSHLGSPTAKGRLYPHLMPLV